MTKYSASKDPTPDPSMLGTDSTNWMTAGFVGYGRLDSDLWLLGMEEHCLNDADAATRLAVLPSFPQTLGVSDAHRRYGFHSLPACVAVWEVASDLAHACGLGADHVGEADGNVLLAELLPLPRPTNHDDDWPAAYDRLFAGYRQYATALLNRRASRYASLIVDNSPRVVVCHGARYHDVFESAIVACGGAPRRTVTVGNKQARLLQLGLSTIVLVHNFGRTASWSESARTTLSKLVAMLWRGESIDEFTSSSAVSIEMVLAGMFHHRMGNVLPPRVASSLPGFALDASKTTVRAVVRSAEFRRWATSAHDALNGQTPIDVCITRDRSDLLNDARRCVRLRKRYGGRTEVEIRSAVEAAHFQVRTWAESPTPTRSGG
jgi:hypothetical protein